MVINVDKQDEKEFKYKFTHKSCNAFVDRVKRALFTYRLESINEIIESENLKLRDLIISFIAVLIYLFRFFFARKYLSRKFLTREYSCQGNFHIFCLLFDWLHFGVLKANLNQRFLREIYMSVADNVNKTKQSAQKYGKKGHITACYRTCYHTCYRSIIRFTPYFHILPNVTTTSKRNIYFFQILIKICNPWTVTCVVACTVTCWNMYELLLFLLFIT